MKRVTIRVPATTANLGPGFDAFGCALKLYTDVTFEERLAAKELCHMGQPSMVSSVTNCEKRTIGTNGGFGYRSINEAYDIALMDSMILAQWICGQKTKKSAKRQKISY